MGGRALFLDPEAVVEAEAARDWYAERNPQAAEGFATELEAAVQAIMEAPERWSKYVAGTRRFLLHRYPFYLVYRVRVSTIELIAVAHARRRPGYWLARLG